MAMVCSQLWSLPLVKGFFRFKGRQLTLKKDCRLFYWKRLCALCKCSCTVKMQADENKRQTASTTLFRTKESKEQKTGIVEMCITGYGIPLIHSYLFPNCNNADIIHIFFAALVLLAPMVPTQWRCSQMAIYSRQPILKRHDLFPCRLSRRPLEMFLIRLQVNIHFHSV